MHFYADLHIHSKHSRATSRSLDLEHLAVWGRKKGVTVLATGDFTHPVWFDELRDKLVPAEPGLFRLRPELERWVDDQLEGPAQGEPVRFMLEVEISTIYKKDEKTRKVHHLLYAPDFDKAAAINAALGRIGNLASDGRPILGLDSRHLLEITLEAGEGCYLVPAHIWTPWFAALGSKSGFDSIEHCYADLTPHIFALETGLSSDPAMNRRLSMLDRYTLVSNSDAHSPSKVGREACAFDAELDYFAIKRSLETGQGYAGTVEFFPEEGKYHLDGHRKCGVRWEPGRTKAADGACPVCGKPLTLGVMHRVDDLADRAEAEPTPRQDAFTSLVPLEEVVAEIQGKGPKSKAVQAEYESLIARMGPELSILGAAPLEDVRRAGSTLLAEAVGRMREGRVIRQAGYDGEYGVIRLFEKDELRQRSAMSALFDLSEPEPEPAPLPARVSPAPENGDDCRAAPDVSREADPDPVAGVLGGLDPDQRRAAGIVAGPLLIIAGPGTGKTRTLTHRLAHLLADHGAAPQQCLAITFTRRAADELRERLNRLRPDGAKQLTVTTFHGLGWSIVREHAPRLGLPPSPRVADPDECADVLQQAASVSTTQARRWLNDRTRWQEDDPSALAAYQREMRSRGMVDFDDLIELPVRAFEEHADLLEHYRERFRYICIDEYQDIDARQYRLVRLLAPGDANLCAIGDPDQAIYGFRGADVGYFQRFKEDYPTAQAAALTRNYRSTRTIVDASLQLIAPSSLAPGRQLAAQADGFPHIEIHQCSSDRAEAELVTHTIERMIGGSSYFSLDSGRVESNEGASSGDEGNAWSFADFAVLYRTDAQAAAAVEALTRSGMPFQKRSHERLAEQPSVRALVEQVRAGDDDRPVTDRIAAAARALRDTHPELDLVVPALQRLAPRHGRDLAGFQSELTLGVEADLWDPRADRVSLLTLHAAKGLEFPVVFIVGCEDGLIPLRFGPGDESDAAEERRLFFVGMTRAQQQLILTHARRRPWRGRVREPEPSPFLRDIERRLVAAHQQRAVRRAGGQATQMALFKP